jgi:energy-coupling factor transporter ATP-binding protein EcfA2
VITLRNLTLRRGTKVVLQDANLVLNPGEKIGLVGRNGAGKSSLFALLAGRLQADAGDAEIPPTWRLGEVAQHMPETDDGAADFVLQGDQPLTAAQAALAAAEAGRRRSRHRRGPPGPRRGRGLRRPVRGRRPCCWAWASAAQSSRPRSTASQVAGACDCSWHAH